MLRVPIGFVFSLLLLSFSFGGCTCAGPLVDDIAPPETDAGPAVIHIDLPADDAGVIDTNAPTLCDLSRSVFTPHCVRCHGEGAALDLRSTELTNGIFRVVDADAPLESLLLRKIEGTLEAGEGSQMPPDGALETVHVDEVRAWIVGDRSIACFGQRPVGDGCDVDTDCATGLCEENVCSADEATCFDLGSDCFSDGDCCEGFCSLNFDSYGPGACTAPLADGEYCTWNTQCAGGGCLDNACTSECGAVGAECTWSGITCCPGTVCVERGPYVPGECAPPLSPGAYCEFDVECLSRQCVDNACTP